MISVEVSASVYPTEDAEKVSLAISNMFKGIEIEAVEVSADPSGPASRLFGRGGIELLTTLHRLFREEGIIDSVRNKAFGKGLSKDGTASHFLLNKQVAFVGVASIPAEEEPLGSIEVNIRADSPAEMERLFEWILPPTEDGKPISEVGMDYVEG